MKALDKIRDLRKSVHLRSSKPQRAYENRLRRPKKILKIIEAKKLPVALVYEARRQYVVTLACAFELFWRETIRILLDNPEYDVTRLRGLDSIKMSLADLAEVFHDEITLGELVSCSLSFQGISHVNKAISTILGIDAFREYCSYRFQLLTRDPKTKQFHKMEPVCLGPVALRRSTYIDKCFEIRHDSVHNTGTRYRVKSELIMKIEDAIWIFNWTFSDFAKHKFRSILG